MARSARLLVAFTRKHYEQGKVSALLNRPEKEPRLPGFCETVFFLGTALALLGSLDLKTLSIFSLN